MSVRALRRGSIAASRVTAPAGVTVLTLPGTSGNYVSTPDSLANSITGDIDIRVLMTLPDWTPADVLGLVSKWQNAGTKSYRWSYVFDGTLTATITGNNGTTSNFARSANGVGFVDGTTHWVRMTWSNSSDLITYYTSEDGDTWTPLDVPLSLPSAGIYDGTAPVCIGITAVDAVSQFFAGNIHYVEIRNGINGTVVAKFDPANDVTVVGTRNPSSFVSSTGETWTINGSAWEWATA